jgi:PAS domain S-box-containing protein
MAPDLLTREAERSPACCTSFGRFEFSLIFAAAPVIAAFLATLRVYFRHLEVEVAMQAERVVAAEHAAAESARHLAELRESEDRFQSAFTHAAVGMVLVSTEGRILQVNTSLARLLGRSEPDFAGTDLMQMFHPDDQEALRTEMRGILIGVETSFSVELRCRHYQGIDVWTSLNAPSSSDHHFRGASSCSCGTSPRGPRRIAAAAHRLP